jgi:hypothetical protein
MIIHAQIRMCHGEAGGRSTGILRMLVTAEVMRTPALSTWKMHDRGFVLVLTGCGLLLG